MPETLQRRMSACGIGGIYHCHSPRTKVRMEKLIVRYSWMIALGLIALLLLAFHFISPRFISYVSLHGSAESKPVPSLSCNDTQHILHTTHTNDAARGLIDAIKQATTTASGSNSSFELTAEERAAWNRHNPCQSRYELTQIYSRRKLAKHFPDSPVWDEVFAEYSKLHRTCMQQVGDITRYFNSRNTSTGCKFAIGDIAGGTGLGNKVLVAASSLLYAILTQRVLLVPTSTLLPSIMCEPFLGSSWILDSNFPSPPARFNDVWELDDPFFKGIDDFFERCQGNAEPRVHDTEPIVYATGVRTFPWQPETRYYCATEQAFYSRATWVYLSGCIYTIPKLFATPVFRSPLESLFPDKMVLTRLLRSGFLPDDQVWNRVRRVKDAYLEHADRIVGIQLRYKDGKGQYNEMNDLINKRVEDCAIKNDILPIVKTSWDSDLMSNSSSPAPVIKVFIASLFLGLRDHLNKIYLPYPTVTGESVGLYQITHDDHQEFHLEEDRQAFTEVLALSFSDQLIVTPISTFGYLAQGYGALTSWFINYGNDAGLEPCERGQTVDACNQFSSKKFSCSHDPDVDSKYFSEVVPYIRDCLSIDHGAGIQLITDFQS